MKIFGKKTRTMILFFSLISLASIGYFGVYYHVLLLSFSVRACLLILLFCAFLTSLVYVSRTFIWHAIVSIFLTVVLILGLVNFVYIDVYGSFIPYDAAGGSLATMLETAQEFYTGVPMVLYILTALFLVVFTGATWWIRKKKIAEKSISFCNQYVDNPFERKYLLQLMNVLFVIIVLTVSLFTTDYIQKNPRDGWWSDNYLVSDLGIPGYIFVLIERVFVPHSISDDVAYANTVEKLTEISENLPESGDIVSSTPQVEQGPQTPYDFLNIYLKKLGHNYATHTDEINVPDFASNSPHILVYQLESVDTWAINHEPSPMPYFKQLIQDNIHAEKFFANGCHTIDAEFVSLCGMYPDPGTAISDVGSDILYPPCLPDILEKEKGYDTAVFHTNDASFWNRKILDPKWGFDHMFFAPDHFEDAKLDDSIPLAKAVGYMASSTKPVFAQVIGFVSHMNHTEEDLQEVERNSNLKLARFTQDIDPEILARNSDLDEQQMRDYFAYLTAVDNDIKGLFELLEVKKMLDNTIVVIVNDHRLYNFPEKDETNFYLYNELPFLMYVPGMGRVTARDIATHVDIAPSIIDLVLGKDFADPYYFMGKSIFSKDHPNFSLSSCNNYVGYVNSNEIILGNRVVNQYLKLSAKKDITDFEVQKVGNAAQTFLSMVKNMIRSDLLVQQ